MIGKQLLLRVIDIETTGLEPPAEIIEIGRADVNVGLDGAGIVIRPPKAHLYRPFNDIPPETKAVHHITEADFSDDTPACTSELLRSAVWDGGRPDVLVAHNCDFELKFIKEAAHPFPWICTYKSALQVWPEAPAHTNQVLRYWLNLDLDPRLAMPPHRAGPDAWVTAHILAELLKTTSVEQMIAWTSEPELKITFGKHKGMLWSDVDADYLRWIYNKSDLKTSIKQRAAQEITQRTSAIFGK